MRTLSNAIEHGKVHHAYLFVGSRGTGKTSMAKILAACLNCVSGPDDRALRRLRVLRLDRQRHVAGRHRDGRGVQQLGRRHPRPARGRRLRAGERAQQGLHPRRGAHALHRRVERVPQDARGAAAEHGLRAGHDRGGEGAADGGRPLPSLRLHSPDGRTACRSGPPRRRARRASRSAPTPSACSPGTPPARSATRSARSSSSSPTAARRLRSTTSWRCSAWPTPTWSSARSTRSPPAIPKTALLAVARLGGTGRDMGGFMRDLEIHARELLVVQTLGSVPAEIAITPDRDAAPGRAGRAA